MKYIRTKDRIIDVSKITIGKDGWESVEEYIAFKQEDQLEQIKQADTIEELCDEYVCVMPSGETFLLDKNTDLKAQVSYIGDVYGEIWVDGELHKVAKMNEKGELELL